MKPRVLLVEDDASIRRFVALALEDLDIDLVEAPTLADAHAVLAAAPVRLLITDLMLPDGSGLTLLQALAADPARRAGARLVAFSAGVTAERRAQLEALGVDEVLAKPVALLALEDCVRRAIGAGAADPPPAPAPDPVAEYFGGNRALYDSYRASCRRQFGADIAEGDTALAAGDARALRRLGHSLKTVLLTLGDTAASAQALKLENEGASGDATRAGVAWVSLRQTLQRMLGPGTD